jgi:hypothetical protein
MKARTVLATLIALFAILTLLDRFGPFEVLTARHGLAAVLALAVGFACAGWGALLRRASRIDFPLDFLLGYPLFGTLLFLIALVKIAAWTLLPVLLLGCAAAILYLWRWYRRSSTDGAPAHEPVPLRWPALFVFAVLGYGLMVAMPEPLPVPHTWLLEGRAMKLPLLDESHAALGIESAALLPLTILGPISGTMAAHLLHWLAALATTALVLRRTGSWLAAAAIVTTPALALGWAPVVWPLTGLFIALYGALEEDDRTTASVATAAGLLTSFFFLAFAIAAWALKRRVPHWIALAGVVFFLRGDFPDLMGERAVALADYVFERPLASEALGASLLTLTAFVTGPVAIAAALLALGLFLLGSAARLLVPYLAVAALSAAPALQRRLVAVLVTIAVVLQTFVVIRTKPEERKLSTNVQWLNAVLPRESRTLVIGERDLTAFARPVRGGDIERISRYVDLPSTDAVHERLRADGITHVAVIEQKEGDVLTPGAQKMLAQTLDRYSATVNSRGEVTLFTLR